MKHTTNPIILGAFGALLAACSLPGGDASDTTFVACTEEFRIATITVLDQSNMLVGGASVLVTVPRTRDTLTVQSLALWAQGTYPIVDDGAKDKLNVNGDTVHVDVTSSKGSANANYVFNVPNGCHINKVSGPDTLKVQ